MFFRKIILLFVFFIFSCIASNAQVLINEYSASNVNSFTDNFGSYEDWIELYNTSGSPVNLNGYYLSNKKTAPAKWQLGNVTIAANGFLRIWASGNNINSGPNLHANFSLTQCKPDAIVFSNPSGVIIDSLTMKPAQAGHSRGRTTNGAPTWSVFLSPTPGASNTNPYLEYATIPTMNLAPGFYPASQNVSITSPDPNITIHYTTDGSTPTNFSPTYSAPVTISVTTVLRAAAFSSTAFVPVSFVESNTYFIGVTHTVAVVSVFGDQIASLMNGTQFSPEAGIQYFDSSGTFRTEAYGTCNKHGNDSWSYPQRGIDFVSYDQYGYSYALLHRFFNMKTRTEFQRIILKAAANDNYPFECPAAGNPYAWGDPTLFDAAHIRDSYVHTVAQKAGMHLDARTWVPCVTYINGQYWGVYDLREKVDDKDFTKYYYNSSSDSLQMLQTWGSTWSAYGGAQAQTDWNNLANFILSNNMAIQANYHYVDSLYSVKSLADYVILNSYAVTSDWLNWNTEWWRGMNAACSKKKWRYCLWDEDATFHHYINYTGIPNNNANADPCDPQSLGDPGGQGHVPILNALLQNPGFKQYYVLRYFDLVNAGLSCKRMTDILDSMILQITPEMPKQINKWGGSMSAWQQNVSNLRNFILARCDSVIHKFDSCYNTTGPFPIKVNVAPAGSGTVDFNSLHITNFVWAGNYPGNITVNLTAHSNPPYCFDHWELQNNTPLPNANDSSITVNLTMTDSIIAHFVTGNVTALVTSATPTICAGRSTTLNASGGTNFSWIPSTGLSSNTIANPIANPTATTTYSVIVSDVCGVDSAAITINVSPDPLSSFTSAIDPCQTSVQFTDKSANANSWLWIFGDGNTSTLQNPAHAFSSSGTYTVTLVAYNSICSDTLQQVETISSDNSPSPAIANVFSPNGDGINDVFSIGGLENCEPYSIKIYNRWGTLVFETEKTGFVWDGHTSAGVKAEAGVYYYVLKNADTTKTGFVTLLR